MCSSAPGLTDPPRTASASLLTCKLLFTIQFFSRYKLSFYRAVCACIIKFPIIPTYFFNTICDTNISRARGIL